MTTQTSSLWLISALILASMGCRDAAGGADGEVAMVWAPTPIGEGGSAGLSQSGAQDFALFRQILDEGGIPAPNTLDAMGFFAEHKLDYPDANCGQDVCVQTLLGVTGNMITGSNCTLVQLGLNTPLDPEELPRPPLHLVLALDTSTSMEGTPLEFIKGGLERMLDALMPEDSVSLVTFNDAATVVLSDVPATERLTLLSAFSALTTQEGSNLYDGLFTAFSVSQGAHNDAGQNRVVLVSDGIASVGITEAAKFISLARAYAKEGIGITTIGLGEVANADVMRSLAEVGGGNFYFLEEPEAVREVFTDEVKTFLYPVATEVEIAIAVGDAYRIGRVYGTKGWTGDAQGGRVEIPALYLAGRSDASEPIEVGRRGGGGGIIFELLPQPDSVDVADPFEVLTVDATWKEPRMKTALGDSVAIMNPALPGVVQSGGYFEQFSVEKGFVMVNILVGFEIAATFAFEGDYASALAVLEAMQPALDAWLAENPDPDIGEDARYVVRFIENLRAASEGVTIQLPPPVEPWPAGD